MVKNACIKKNDFFFGNFVVCLFLVRPKQKEKNKCIHIIGRLFYSLWRSLIECRIRESHEIMSHWQSNFTPMLILENLFGPAQMYCKIHVRAKILYCEIIEWSFLLSLLTWHLFDLHAHMLTSSRKTAYWHKENHYNGMVAFPRETTCLASGCTLSQTFITSLWSFLLLC